MNTISSPHFDRLSHIETVWTMVFDAHGNGIGDAGRAQHELLGRYGNAILRYLHGAFRDETMAEETFQEFAIRFLRGDYKAAHPDKGCFRGFLKVVLSRLVADHYRTRSRRREATLEPDHVLPDETDSREREKSFQEVWRDELLTKAWQRLAEEQTRTGKPWLTVLRLRVEEPELRSEQLAQRLGALIGQDVTATRLRVWLHRSREKFANYLIDAVAESLSSDDIDDIEQELADLQLLYYCQSVIEHRKTLARV